MHLIGVRIVKEKPILFSGPMVRAILEVRKTQTRRIVKGIEISGPNHPHTFDCRINGKWVGAFGLDGTGNAVQAPGPSIHGCSWLDSN